MAPAPDGAGDAAASPSVTVVVTVLKDPRVARTLESLLAQEYPFTEILVDDGGVTDEVRKIVEEFSRRDRRVVHLDAPGNIPESRNAALKEAHGELIAFLDADEVAPPGWLGELLRPFADPQVGFVGGPTPALPESLRSIGARYYDGYLRRFYDRVARIRPHALPMGNSAWRARVFQEVGDLDTTLFRRAASEDQDIALRVLARGYRGVYQPSAWVGHDFTDITTWGLLRKQRIYAEGGYVLWRRRGSTYEASVGRIAPYLVPPVLFLAGALLLIPAITRILGWDLLALAVASLGLLALGLTVEGWLGDREYPGLRYRAFEILRRWATLYGALRGLLHFGVSGRARTGDLKP
ncbi:MAG: glycosyltransferase family 2 protein [Thermoplasmata archaeon]